MGGSEKYPLEKINQLIGERMFILKENIDNAGMLKILLGIKSEMSAHNKRLAKLEGKAI